LQTILQNDRIDDLATLHTALSAVVRQILAPFGDHESTAARTTICVVDACPTWIGQLNRLLLCYRQRRTHDASSVIRRFHTIHNEIEWQLAFQQIPARPESSMSMKNRGDGVISFEIISCEQKKCRG